MSNHEPPGFLGLLGISAATVVSAVAITAVTGTYDHWLPTLAGIWVGWLSTRSINR